ncbi:MAG: aminoglycoside phosphotransferase [Alphaproteobacteria bacterium]|nr:aminoglycoside phosphotransferase [Alphaproteobacteria bacterium]
MSDARARRAEARHAFAAAHRWDVPQTLLAGDASFRTYYRLRRGERTMVLMDAPPPQEDVRPFVRIARHLRRVGLSAPAIEAVDEEAGFLLLEDLGDNTYARALAAGGDEAALYRLASDVLVRLSEVSHAAVLRKVSAYEGEALIEATMLLPEWYLPAASGAPCPSELMDSWRVAWRETLRRMPEHPPTLVLRDYHIDNLIHLPARRGVRACGLLDFQDAQSGHPAYDLVSLIEDARRDIAPALRDGILRRFTIEAGVTDTRSFLAAAAILAAQRHARVIGVFVRLWRRDGKPVYLPHLPRVWRLFERALTHPATRPLAEWIETHVPPALRQLRAP